jgi:hypothetical protein
MKKIDAAKLKEQRPLHALKTFFKQHWIGSSVILVITLFFFWPLIMHVGTYSEGGDAMFNAWTLARDQHCILREGCPSYVNGNIYFPHKDTMLYSETQLSAGFLSLPLYFIDQNPIFSYNVMTILSFLLAGWFMYLLVKRLSKGNEVMSIFAGLIFEFAPNKMSSISHLQNLSILYLPLIFLLMLNYIDSKRKKWLVPLFIVLTLQFYASWYQMVFVLLAVVIFILCYLIFKLIKPRVFLLLAGTVVFALIATIPLARDYVKFSKTQDATFTLQDQVSYSASVADYVIPYNGTIIGKLYYHFRPHAKVNAYNPDSYSYNGIIMYAVALFVLIVAFIKRKKSVEWSKHYKLLVTFLIIAIAGFIMSLGPLLKLKSTASYTDMADGLKLAVPLPYILVDKILPQLSFIRAVGRADILVLFSLCVSLAYLPFSLSKIKISQIYKRAITVIVCLLIIIELLPAERVGMLGSKFSYNYNIPAVYKLIKNDKSINDILILRADTDYPGVVFPTVRAEDVLWAGYDNKNIFNGYSGYTPPDYYGQYEGFQHFDKSELSYAESLGIRYILVDKLLSTSNPKLNSEVSALAEKEIYSDSRYSLYKI